MNRLRAELQVIEKYERNAKRRPANRLAIEMRALTANNRKCRALL